MKDLFKSVLKDLEECKTRAPLVSYFVTSGWRSWHKETGLQ